MRTSSEIMTYQVFIICLCLVLVSAAVAQPRQSAHDTRVYKAFTLDNELEELYFVINLVLTLVGYCD